MKKKHTKIFSAFFICLILCLLCACGEGGNGTFCARMSRGGRLTYATGYGMTREDFGSAVVAVLG